MWRSMVFKCVMLIAVFGMLSAFNEPPLRIDGALSNDTLYPSIAALNKTTLTLAVFSDRVTPEQIIVDVQFDAAQLTRIGAFASNGAWRYNQWFGQAWRDHPATLTLQLTTCPTATPGRVTIQSSAYDADGAVAASYDVLAVCCAPFQEPQQLDRIYLPVLRR